MPRKLCTTILLFLITAATVCAEGLDSFMDIPFGATKEVARLALAKQGWMYDPEGGTENLLSFTQTGGTFRGLSVYAIRLYFVDGKMAQVFVSIIQRANDLTDAITEMNKMIKEYGLKKEYNFNWTTNVSRTYCDKAGNQLCGIFYKQEGGKNVIFIFSDNAHAYYR